MSNRLLILAGFATLIFSACNSELDVTAPYQENTVVYALLNKDSTIHYLKINKAFLGPGNAFEYAQVPDSTEYTDSQLDAVIEMVKGGQVVNTFQLRDTIWEHDPGIFAGPYHKLYYFTATLDSTATYRLVATAKGNHITAETPIVGKFTPSPSILSQPLRMVTVGGSYANQTMRWTTGLNGRRYELSYRFRWDDVIGTDTVPRSFIQALGFAVAGSLNGGAQLDVIMGGETFFQTVALRAGDNPAVEKRIFRGVDLRWAVAGPALHDYLQLNNPISGLVEERPTYSNVENGYGIFSSRRFLEVTMNGLSAQTAPELAEGQYTAHLNFCIPGSDFGCN